MARHASRRGTTAPSHLNTEYNGPQLVGGYGHGGDAGAGVAADRAARGGAAHAEHARARTHAAHASARTGVAPVAASSDYTATLAGTTRSVRADFASSGASPDDGSGFAGTGVAAGFDGAGAEHASHAEHAAKRGRRHHGRTRRRHGEHDAYDQGVSDAQADLLPSEAAAARRAEREQTRGGKGARPRKRARSKRRWPKVLAIVLAVIVLAGAGGAWAYSQYINGNLHAGIDSSLRSSLVQTDMTNEPFYVLLLGTDESSDRDESGDYGGSFRSDSIMLLRIDAQNKKATLVSIHRDTMVDLGKYGKQKLNAAYAFGGPALAVQTVSSMAGVGISHYAGINFDGFAQVVDAVGGVQVDVPVEIDDEDAGGHLDAGLQTLNGEQALILCRSRDTYADTSADPDSMRAANQRLVLSALAEKILASDPATIAKTINVLSQYVTTDLDVDDIIGIAQALKGLDPDTDVYTGMQPVTNEYIDGGWYSYTDESAWKTMMKRVDAGLPPNETGTVDEVTGTVTSTSGAGAEDSGQKTASVSVKNGTQVTGAATRAVELLKSAGFTNVVAGNANSLAYPNTLVIYNDDTLQYEANQIVAALGQGTAVKNDGDYVFSTKFLVIIGDDWTGGGTGSGTGTASSTS